ncbi:MAG: UDP-glucose dehydrogenase family protein [Actinomycetota bacterium]
MRLAVVGTGHVGLVTCVTMASVGHDVVGIDADAIKIDSIANGIAPFFEPGLEEALNTELASGRLRFTTDARAAIEGAEVVFISVGTPPRATGEANLIAVEDAARTVARYATGPCVIAEKSTVPTGTARMIRRIITRERPDLAGSLEVVSNPEFLREGLAMHDALQPDRIVVGAESEWAREVMRRAYRPFVVQGADLIETDIATAELAKHACNAFLALKISFANAMARISELSGANVELVTEVMGKDPRIGPAFLKAGIGYGGSCFPKDIQALRRVAETLGYDFPLLDEVQRINDEAVDAVVTKVKAALWNLEDKKVALLGLAFKPGTDDIRFAPALAIARRLIDEGTHVVGYDPIAGAHAQAEIPQLAVTTDPYDAIDGAHCAVVCTEWDEVATLDLERVRDLMQYPIVVDGRNLYDAIRMQALGFTYDAVGMPGAAEALEVTPTA